MSFQPPNKKSGVYSLQSTVWSLESGVHSLLNLRVRLMDSSPTGQIGGLDSRLQSVDSRLQTADSRLWTPDCRLISCKSRRLSLQNALAAKPRRHVLDRLQQRLDQQTVQP